MATTDPIAERVRKLGGITLRSIGEVARRQRIADNDADGSMIIMANLNHAMMPMNQVMQMQR